MAAPKRTYLEIERDLPIISSFYLMGIPQSRIAELLQERTAANYKLSQVMISNDIKKIRDIWKGSAIRNFDEAVNQELAKIDALEMEAWIAWQRSKGNKRTHIRKYDPIAVDTEHRLEVTDDEDEPLQDVINVGTTAFNFEEQFKDEISYGNPQYLTLVQWCINRRIVLLGLDSPTKIRFTNESMEDDTEEISDRKASLMLQILDNELLKKMEE